MLVLLSQKRRILTRSISITAETFPLRRKFAIYAVQKCAPNLSVEIFENGAWPRGGPALSPLWRNSETVTATIEQLRGAVCAGMTRDDLQPLCHPAHGKCAAGLRAVGFGSQNRNGTVWNWLKCRARAPLQRRSPWFWTGQTPWHMQPCKRNHFPFENQDWAAVKGCWLTSRACAKFVRRVPMPSSLSMRMKAGA